MQVTKRWLQLAGAGALALGLVSGAGTAQAVDIKMWTLVQTGLPEFIAFAQAEFQKTHPDVNIVHEQIANETYKTQIQVALTGSEPPDVFFMWAGETAGQPVRNGLALDLTPYADKFKPYVGEGWLGNYKYDGKYYGIPTNAISKFFFYDKGFFAKNNLAVPTKFSELTGLCKAIRAIDPAIVPMPLGNSERWKLGHMMATINNRVLGSEVTMADDTLSSPDDQLYTDAGYVDAWQKVLDLQAAGCFQDAPNATSPEASRAMWSSQASPMIYCGTWCESIAIGEGFTDFGMFNFPEIEGGKGDPAAVLMAADGYMVSSKTKIPDLAAEWVSFMVSDEMALKFAQLLNAIPSNPKLADQIQSSEQYKWILKTMADAPSSYSTLNATMDNTVHEAFLDGGVEILNGTKTPQQVMDNIHKIAVEVKSKK